MICKTSNGKAFGIENIPTEVWKSLGEISTLNSDPPNLKRVMYKYIDK